MTMAAGEEKTPRGYHDLGGHPAGPVDRAEHVLEPWEKRVDVLCGILVDRKRRLMTIDERRDAIERLGEDAYNSMKYYELWMAAALKLVLEKGILNRDAIDGRVDEIRARLGLEAGS